MCTGFTGVFSAKTMAHFRNRSSDEFFRAKDYRRGIPGPVLFYESRSYLRAIP